MTWFETIVGAGIVLGVIYMFLQHKKELKQIESAKTSGRCISLTTHNFPDLKPQSKCAWCGKTLKQLEVEMTK